MIEKVAMESDLLRLPMFPLGTVLFPRQLLPLHVFEPRYRELTADCLGGDREFGVVLISRGSEAGGGENRFAVGTVARIADAALFPDGRWALMTVGSRRILAVRWLPDDPYPTAMVENMADTGLSPPNGSALLEAERAVRSALALASELAEGATAPATFALADDPEAALWQLCAMAPLGPADQQVLLELPDASARLTRLTEMVCQASDVLAYRLAGG